MITVCSPKWIKVGLILAGILAMTLVLCACTPGTTGTPATAGSQKQPAVPDFAHVFLIVEENSESQDILGNPEKPFTNQLATQYAVANQYYAVAHPSLPNYLSLVGGDTFGISSDCTTCWVDQPSVADEIEASGRDWRAYEESMPSPCFVGDAGAYAQKHDPFIYFNSIRENTDRCASHIVPFERFAPDLAQNKLPQFVFLGPNICNDGHDCDYRTADNWLAHVIPTIVASQAFRDRGVIFITWDEGSTDSGCCDATAAGGHVLTLVISPLATPGFTSDAVMTHYSLLRTVEDAWNLAPLGHAAQASPMVDFFTRPR